VDVNRVIDIALLLLGGVGGVFLVWLLDGWRERRRERRRLTAATLVIEIEIAANIGQADQWASLAERYPAGRDLAETLEAGPIEMRRNAWERAQVELANGMPRDLVVRMSAAYGLAHFLAANAEVARRRKQLLVADVQVAKRTRDSFQMVLEELQAFEREQLGVRFTATPAGPVARRASGERDA